MSHRLNGLVMLGAMVAASVNAQPVAATQRAAADPRLRTVVFAADSVVDVPVRRGQITQIVLGDDEQIVGVPVSGKGANCADETHTWCVAKQGRDTSSNPSRAPRRRTSSW